LSRFRALALLAIFAVLAVAVTACGGGGSSDENPQKVIDNATLKGVESGELDLSLSVKAQGKESGNVQVSLSGPFQSEGKENLPELDMTAKANGAVNGKNIDFEGGVTLLSDRAFVDYKGVEYEVDPTTFGIVKSGFERAQQRQGAEAGTGGVTACQEAASELKVSEYVENLTNDGSAEVDGVSTTKVSGDLSAASALGALIKLAENPACSSQLQAVGSLPLSALRKARGEISSAVKKAHIELYVGDDHIIRKAVAELTIEPKRAGAEKAEVDLELSLGKVNEEQSITAPSGAKPLEQLFQQLGVNPIELLELSNGGHGGPGVEHLLEGLTGGASLGGLGGGGSGSSSSGGSSGGGSQAYLECLQGASSAADVQKCASKLQ
jgi:hypothetical protein